MLIVPPAALPVAPPGIPVRIRARLADSWVVMPVAFLLFGLSLAVLGGQDDRLPFDLALLVIVTVAIAYHVWAMRERRRLFAGEVTAERRLAETEAHFSDLVERLPAAVYRDRYRRSDGAFIAVDYVSPKMESLTGYPADAFTEDPDLWVRLVHPDDRTGSFADDIQRHLGDGALEREYRIIRRDGVTIWVREEAYVVASAAADTILSHGLITDVTERKQLEQQLSHMAFHDPLTGLPNRALFEDRLTQALNSRARARRSAVLFLDLDNFKDINDSLGHAAGDVLLQGVASRLSAAVRPADTVARFGGDEFAVLLDDVDDAAGATAAARRLLAALEVPMDIEGRRLIARASLGIALALVDGSTPAELLRNADAAMYRAKAARRGGVIRFEPAFHDEAVARLELETRRRAATVRDMGRPQAGQIGTG